MNISELTGLPELPEGLIFRVGEVKYSGWGMSLFSQETPGAYVAIVRQWKVLSEEKQTKRFLWWDIPFGVKNTSTDMEDVLVHQTIYTKEMVDVDVFNDDGDRTGVKPEERLTRIDADDLTEELIIEHAILAYERWLDITKARGYLGDYPPKHVSSPDLEDTRKKPTVVFKKGRA